MRFTQISAAAALFTTALASTPIPDTTVTKDVEVITSVCTSDYVFYCPTPTTVIHKNSTVTVTSAALVTISNCPCTITYTSEHFITTQPVTVITSNGVVTTSTCPVTTVPTCPPVVPTRPPNTQPIITQSQPVITQSQPGLSTAVVTEPTGTAAPPVPTAGAATDKVNAGLGALVALGLAAMAL